MLSEVFVRGLQPDLAFMHLPSSNIKVTGDLIHKSSILLIRTLLDKKGRVTQEIRRNGVCVCESQICILIRGGVRMPFNN